MLKSIKSWGLALGWMTSLVTSNVANSQPFIEQLGIDTAGKIQIKGSGFGEGPQIALYDNFDKASVINGQLVLEPQIGSWLQTSSLNPELYRESEHDLSLIVRGSSDANLTFGIPDSSGVHGLMPFQEIYFSYAVRDLGAFPGQGGTKTSFSDVSSTKDAWMMFGGRGDNTTYAVSQGSPAGHDLYIPAWTGSGFNIAGNNTLMTPSFWQPELGDKWSFGNWNFNMFHASLNPNDPYGMAEGFFSFINDNSYHRNTRSGNFMHDQSEDGVPYPYWDRIKFFAWMRESHDDVQRIFDEVYIAIGPNANARALVTDAPTLEESSVAYHLPIESWGPNAIVAPIPDHIRAELESAYYLIVLDSDNASSKGFKLCQRCPEPPQVQLQ